MPRPKTFAWQEFARLLIDRGQDEAARIVAAEFGPPPPLYKEIDVRRALQVLEAEEVKAEDLLEPGIRQCLAEFALSSPRVTTWLITWLNQVKESLAQNGILATAAEAAPPRQKRAKITDPEVLAKRSAALEKARAARQERLAASRRQSEAAAEQLAIANSVPVDEPEPVPVG